MLNTPLFGILITVTFYFLGREIYKRWRLPFLHPILIAVAGILLILILFDIPLEHYKKGGALLNMLLPFTITVLALPLFNHIKLLRSNNIAIISGIISGVICSALTTITLSIFLDFNRETAASLLPKSITTPLGIVLSEQLEGVVALSVISIVLTGVLGVVLSPLAFKLFNITNPVAQGVALGTASHAVGTSKALELGKEQGAMSSISLIIAGIVTIITTPLLSLALSLL